jgi:hypothetical protein
VFVSAAQRRAGPHGLSSPRQAGRLRRPPRTRWISAGAALDVRRWTRIDDTGAQAAFDELARAASASNAIPARPWILPYLHDLGQRWANGEASVPLQEHIRVGR